jgi:trehalose-6-phosphatase
MTLYFAAGDDYTDEDLFAALPEGAFTVKIGLGQYQCRIFPEILAVNAPGSE